MTFEKWRTVAEMTGLAAVVASLIFGKARAGGELSGEDRYRIGMTFTALTVRLFNDFQQHELVGTDLSGAFRGIEFYANLSEISSEFWRNLRRSYPQEFVSWVEDNVPDLGGNTPSSRDE